MSDFVKNHTNSANEYKKMFDKAFIDGDKDLQYMSAGMYNAHMWVLTGEEKYRENSSLSHRVNARNRWPGVDNNS